MCLMIKAVRAVGVGIDSAGGAIEPKTNDPETVHIDYIKNIQKVGQVIIENRGGITPCLMLQI